MDNKCVELKLNSPRFPRSESIHWAITAKKGPGSGTCLTTLMGKRMSVFIPSLLSQDSEERYTQDKQMRTSFS